MSEFVKDGTDFASVKSEEIAARILPSINALRRVMGGEVELFAYALVKVARQILVKDGCASLAASDALCHAMGKHPGLHRAHEALKSDNQNLRGTIRELSAELDGVVSLVGGVRDGETISAAMERWHKNKCSRLDEKLKDSLLTVHAMSLKNSGPMVCQPLPAIDNPARAEVVASLTLRVDELAPRLAKLEAMHSIAPGGIQSRHGSGDIHLEVTEKK